MSDNTKSLKKITKEDAVKFLDHAVFKVIFYPLLVILCIIIITGRMPSGADIKTNVQEAIEIEFTEAFNKAAESEIMPKLDKLCETQDQMYDLSVYRDAEFINKQAWKIVHDPGDIKPGDFKLSIILWEGLKEKNKRFPTIIEEVETSIDLIKKWKEKNIHLFLS